MLRRDRVPGGRELVAGCEAFLAGLYVDYLVDAGAGVPAWAWTNLLAHGTDEQLCAAAEVGPVGAGGLEPWCAAQSYLAGEVLELAHRNGPLGKVQARALVPLELELVADPRVNRWGPGEWVAAVLASLVPLGEWQPARRRS